MTEMQMAERSELQVSEASDDTRVQHFDVLIIGAGLSGICAAYHLQTKCKTRSFAILEGRDAIGGTWDLFRYPGIRSDSDMHTMGFSFRPWKGETSIAPGGEILDYIRDTAKTYDIDRRIKFRHRAVRASWNTDRAEWLVDVETGAEGRAVRLSCSFLYTCSGYYNYEEGYLPEWPGMDRYQGLFVHPQKWPEDLDYTSKRIVIIGSGATAVTLIPSLAERGEHVTMLQRSPGYVATLPAQDKIANRLHRWLPSKMAHSLVRWKNLLYGMYIYNVSKRRPEFMKRALIKMARQQLPADFDVEKHFTPTYNPWDQRLCLDPDAAMFKAIRSRKASIVTDHIETFTETGIRLKSGEHLEADIVVTATGLQLKLLGGMELIIDGKPADLSKTWIYKGMMYSDVPNLASAFGYTNASWTLKCELTAQYVCRLLNHMESHGHSWCAPRRNDPSITEEEWLALSSGYIQRARHMLPKQGSAKPWKLHQNYFKDISLIQYGAIDDGTMEFGGKSAAKRAA